MPSKRRASRKPNPQEITEVINYGEGDVTIMLKETNHKGPTEVEIENFEAGMIQGLPEARDSNDETNENSARSASTSKPAGLQKVKINEIVYLAKRGVVNKLRDMKNGKAGGRRTRRVKKTRRHRK